MSETSTWAFPENLQPRPDEVGFDLEDALSSVVLLRSEIPEDAFTASILGTERLGNGVVIREDGLVLTIGYLITEAHTIWLTTNAGRAVAGHPLAYDQATGFGLVQPLGRLGVPALPRGSAASSAPGDDVIVIGCGGRHHALKAKVVAKREFAGYWEYLLEEALFTAPAHPQWGGAAVINADGQLLGIGSLLVQEVLPGDTVQGNMIVPIDLLDPILDDLLKLGRSAGKPRPWLGMYTTEANGQLVVGGLAKGGPAERAGVKMGDLMLEVAGERVSGLADMLRKVWRLGPAGTEVPLTVARGGAPVRVRLRSADRNDFLKKPQLH
ncbi:MAG TPA: S1C family serine protease [Burkholderiales bacterium]|nr:S1C family serine protease [Burkholderiales bacterium]